MACERFGPKTYLELTTRTGYANGSLISHYLGSDHRDGFALGRVHLPRHYAATGFVFRQAEFPKPASRAGAKESNVICDLHERTGDDIQSAMRLDESVV
jgi:hypothetical protein